MQPLARMQNRKAVVASAAAWSRILRSPAQTLENFDYLLRGSLDERAPFSP
jgi:hypothetical protein